MRAAELAGRLCVDGRGRYAGWEASRHRAGAALTTDPRQSCNLVACHAALLARSCLDACQTTKEQKHDSANKVQPASAAAAAAALQCRSWQAPSKVRQQFTRKLIDAASSALSQGKVGGGLGTLKRTRYVGASLGACAAQHAAAGSCQGPREGITPSAAEACIPELWLGLDLPRGPAPQATAGRS